MSERVKRETSKKPKLQIMRITWRTGSWRGDRGRGTPCRENHQQADVNEGMIFVVGWVEGAHCGRRSLLFHSLSLPLSPAPLALPPHSISRNQILPSAIPVECFDLQANHKNKCIKSNGKSMEPTINCVDGIARGLYKLFYCSNNTKEFGCPATTTTTTSRIPLPLFLFISLCSHPLTANSI